MMKWFDRMVTAASSMLVFVSGVDAFLHGLRIVPILLCVFLASIVISFQYLKERSSPQPPQTNGILDQRGIPITMPEKRRRNLALIVNRAVLIVASIGLAVTLWVYRSTPSLTVNVDRIQEFEIVKGATKTVYSTAGKYEGDLVYGRGHQVLVSLANHSTLPLDVTSLELRLESTKRSYPQTLRYDKLQVRLPHTRLPVEALTSPIHWGEYDKPGALKALGVGRIRLDPRGEKSDIHQIAFTVEALSPGLWSYVIVVKYIEPKTRRHLQYVSDEKFSILLRGK